jgi:hypothetical protein
MPEIDNSDFMIPLIYIILVNTSCDLNEGSELTRSFESPDLVSRPTGSFIKQVFKSSDRLPSSFYPTETTPSVES